MTDRSFTGLVAAAMLACAPATAWAAPAAGYAEVLAALPDSAWVRPDPEDLLYLDLDSGRVVILLAPGFAPRHVANLRRLARAHYFDDVSVMRVQDDYVTQWGGDEATRPLPEGVTTLAPEFERAIGTDSRFTRLKDGDVYAKQVGHSGGFPVARDPARGMTWLTHCYGMVGVGRDLAADSGSGAELYTVIGHAPRHLDRNMTLVGRVVLGMDLLTALPRGRGDLGFYTPEQHRLGVRGMRVEADLPPAERVGIEIIDTSAPDFGRLVEARRNRQEAFFKVRAGRIDLCNVPLPTRTRPASASSR